MKLFLIPVIRWLASLPWSDFLRIVGAVADAAILFRKSPMGTDASREAVNASRADFVRKFIGERFPTITGWARNAILELAVAWFNRKGAK